MLYFLPKSAAKTQLDVAQIKEEFGLETLWRDVEQNTAIAINQIKAGPDGGPGVVVRPHSTRRPPDVRYLPKVQTWEKLSGGAWFGFGPEVKSEDYLRIERGQPIQGWKVALSAGGEWIVPAIRYTNSENAAAFLPCTLKRTEEGLIKIPMPEYSGLFDRMGLVWEQLDDPEKRDGDPFVFDAVCDAMSLNYRIDPEIASILGMFSPDNLESAALVCCGWRLVEAMLEDDESKKNEA